MANDTRQRLGEMVPVENDSRKFGSAKEYCAVYVEVHDIYDIDGNELFGEVVPLMLTPREYTLARERAAKNPEDMPGYRKRFTEKFRR
jgi:hypothetical protein